MGRERERERDDLDLDLDAVIPTISRFPNFYVFYLLGCCCNAMLCDDFFRCFNHASGAAPNPFRSLFLGFAKDSTPAHGRR